MRDDRPWQVFLTERAEQERARLPARDQGRIRDALLRLQGGLGQGDVRKLQDRENEWGLLVGRYRVLFGIDRPARTFVVFRVQPRGSAYRA